MYNTIIFDLDDTLTDNLENVKQAFKTVMDYRNEKYSNKNFLRFYEIDNQLWSDRANGKLITPYEDNKEKKAEWLRANRFIKYYNEKINYEEAVNINRVYMNGMKEKVISREGSFEIIKYLYEKGYKIIIATNGPIVPLETKIEKLKINEYIDTIFSAEEIGFMKPHKNFYKGLFKKAKISLQYEILFICDSVCI